MAGAPRSDLYRRLELAIRTPLRPLPVDAFLPAPEALPSAIPAPEPVTTEGVSEAHGFVQQMRKAEPVEVAPSPPRTYRKKKKSDTESTVARSLQEEIEEFMNRDGGALAPDFDPEE